MEGEGVFDGEGGGGEATIDAGGGHVPLEPGSLHAWPRVQNEQSL